MSVVFENSLNSLGQDWFIAGDIIVGDVDFASYRLGSDPLNNSALIQSAINEASTRVGSTLPARVRIVTSTTVGETLSLRETFTTGEVRKLAVQLKDNVEVVISAGCTITFTSNNGTSVFGNYGSLKGASVICEGLNAFNGSANSSGSVNNFQSAVWLDARSGGCTELSNIQLEISGTRTAGHLVRGYNSNTSNVSIAKNINTKILDAQNVYSSVFMERNGESINSEIINCVGAYLDGIIYKDGVKGSITAKRVVSSTRHGVRIYINTGKTGADQFTFNDVDVKLDNVSLSGDHGINIAGMNGKITFNSTFNQKSGLNFGDVVNAGTYYYSQNLVIYNSNAVNNNQNGGQNCGLDGTNRNIELIAVNASDDQTSPTQYRGINFSNSRADYIKVVSATCTGNTNSQIVVKGINSYVNPGNGAVIGWNRLVIVTSGTKLIDGPEDSYLLAGGNLQLPRYSDYALSNYVQYNVAASVSGTISARQELDSSYKPIANQPAGTVFNITNSQSYQFVRNADQWRLSNATNDSPATLTNKTISSGSKLDSLADENMSLYGVARQAIINGNFDIWERGTSFTNPASDAYTADRWKLSYSLSGTPPNITISRETMIPNIGSKTVYGYKIAWDGAGSGLGTNDSYAQLQHIENGTRLLCGLNKKVTVSIKARSSVANKKLGFYLVQNYGTGGSPSAEEIITGGNVTLSTTDTVYTRTFTTNTLIGKTFGTNNDDTLRLVIVEIWGTGSMATRVNSAGISEGFISAGNIVISSTQINAGDVALPFQPRSANEELRLCQRYYQKFGDSNGFYSRLGGGLNSTTSQTEVLIPLVATLRTKTPSIGYQNLQISPAPGTAYSVTNISLINVTASIAYVAADISGTQTLSQYSMLQGDNSTQAFISFNSDF